MKWFWEKDDRPKNTDEGTAPESVEENMEEIVAAIGVALRMYSYKAMEYEETIITIQKVMKPYSPWNSKIYTLKQMPQRIITRRPLK